MSRGKILAAILGGAGLLLAAAASAAPADTTPEACNVFRAAAASEAFAKERAIAANVTFGGPVVSRWGVALGAAVAHVFPELEPLDWPPPSGTDAAKPSCDLTSVGPDWRVDSKTQLQLIFNQPVFLKDRAVVEIDWGILIFDDVLGATNFRRFPPQLCLVSHRGRTWTDARCVDYPNF